MPHNFLLLVPLFSNLREPKGTEERFFERIKADFRVYKTPKKWVHYREAQVNLGYAYLFGGDPYNYGENIQQNHGNALIWFEKAALQGNSFAQNNLGIMYLSGDGVPQNYVKAFEWTEKTALQNLPTAQNSLGNIYYQGRGILITI